MSDEEKIEALVEKMRDAVERLERWDGVYLMMFGKEKVARMFWGKVDPNDLLTQIARDFGR